MRIRVSFLIALALVLAQASFGATVAASAGSSSCANQSGAPFDIGGTLYAYFTCSLYNDANSYTIPLTSLMTETGTAGTAQLSDNVAAAGYFVVSNNLSQLFNQSFWQTVLYFPGTLEGGYSAESLSVYWPGAFPSAAVVQGFNGLVEAYYAGPPNFVTVQDSDFFIQAGAGYETVYQPNGPCTDGPCSDEYDIYSTPEPGTIVLLGSSLALLCGVVLRRRRTVGRAA